MQFSRAAVEAAIILAERRRSGAPGQRLPDTCRPADVAIGFGALGVLTVHFLAR